MVAQIDRTYAKMRPTRLYSRLLGYALFEGRPLTTRGRWINPLLFALYRGLALLPGLKRVSAPIFILGTGRSGSTILGVVLSAHRDVGFLNEPKAVWHFAHGGEDLIGSYSSAAASYRLAPGDASARVKSRLHRVFGAYLRLGLNSRLVDKYPEMIFRTGFVREIFPDARFLLLVRDGAETCASIKRWSERLGQEQGGETHDWWGRDDRKWHLLCDLVSEHADLAPHEAEIRTFDSHVDRAALEWLLTMREALKVAAGDPDGSRIVRYERLASEPGAAFPEVLEFCDLRPDANMIAYAEAVMDPAPPAELPPLRPEIASAFADTMADLGYAANQVPPRTRL